MSMHKTYALALLLAVFSLVQALAAGHALAADPFSTALQADRLQ